MAGPVLAVSPAGENIMILLLSTSSEWMVCQ